MDMGSYECYIKYLIGVRLSFGVIDHRVIPFYGLGSLPILGKLHNCVPPFSLRKRTVL